MSKNSPALASTHLPLGKITKAHGLRGGVVVALDPSLEGTLRPGIVLEISGNTARTALTVRTCTQRKAGALVTFDGVADREAAEELIGARLAVTRDSLPALEPGEYYDIDLVGSEVVAVGGAVVGRLAEVIATGANDVYVVAATEGEILVPAIDGVVLEIDLEGRRVVVETAGLAYPERRS